MPLGNFFVWHDMILHWSRLLRSWCRVFLHMMREMNDVTAPKNYWVQKYAIGWDSLTWDTFVSVDVYFNLYVRLLLDSIPFIFRYLVGFIGSDTPCFVRTPDVNCVLFLGFALRGSSLRCGVSTWFTRSYFYPLMFTIPWNSLSCPWRPSSWLTLESLTWSRGHHIPPRVRRRSSATNPLLVRLQPDHFDLFWTFWYGVHLFHWITIYFHYVNLSSLNCSNELFVSTRTSFRSWW